MFVSLFLSLFPQYRYYWKKNSLGRKKIIEQEKKCLEQEKGFLSKKLISWTRQKLLEQEKSSLKKKKLCWARKMFLDQEKSFFGKKKFLDLEKKFGQIKNFQYKKCQSATIIISAFCFLQLLLSIKQIITQFYIKHK